MFSFNIYLEGYITFGLFKNIPTFYRLFSCFLLYLIFILPCLLKKTDLS